MEKNLSVWLNIQFPAEANMFEFIESLKKFCAESANLGTVEVNFTTVDYVRTGDRFYGK